MNLSFIIPIYNVENHIAQTVRDINSKYTEQHELIIVDDGSTDNSPQIVKELQREVPTIRYISLGVNLGAGVARNRGLKEASGKYLLFFDADDHLRTGVLEKMIAALEFTGADLSIARYEYGTNAASSDSGRMHPPDERRWDEIIGDAPSRVTTIQQSPSLLQMTNYPWTKVIRADYARKIELRFSETKVNNDIFAHWQSLMLSERVVMINESVCFHIVPATGNNITNRKNEERFDIFRALDDVDVLFDQRPRLRKLYYQRFIHFKLDMAKWAINKIDRPYYPRFIEELERSFRDLRFDDYLRAKSRMPKLAEELLDCHFGRPKFVKDV
ncbi:glycosyltransferase [Hoeflea sp. WL0058]|uniref:Glycosyltransferase n=1 Tax=Flavimaribacter sediminis TaxID=2865987 RepID=A0AAE3D0V1_9HYPH|nr:glycosyltransferase [Flavimaribacter sediminis]MBW8638154.1 glycosyltransferase [Flavimaribacter sediminis]